MVYKMIEWKVLKNGDNWLEVVQEALDEYMDIQEYLNYMRRYGLTDGSYLNRIVQDKRFKYVS